MLVFTSIEELEVIPSKLDGPFKTLKAVKNGTFILAWPSASISVGVKIRVVHLKGAEGCLCVHLHNYYHKRAHQVARIGDLGEISALRVVVDASLSLETVTFEQLLQLSAKSVRH